MAIRISTAIDSQAVAGAARLRQTAHSGGFHGHYIAAVGRSITPKTEATVQAGDTLSEIVARHLQSQGRPVTSQAVYQGVQKTAEANHLDNPNLIFPEQRIDLSALNNQAAPAAAVSLPARPVPVVESLSLDTPMPESLPMPVEGRISSGYGMRFHPIHHEPRFHKGIDVAAPAGAPVRSVMDGVVESAGWQRGYGQTVSVRHADGRSTLYAHLSAILVKDGETLKAGQEIGAVGSSGNSTGPHLHFELRENGAAVNPMAYLNRGTRLASAK